MGSGGDGHQCQHASSKNERRKLSFAHMNSVAWKYFKNNELTKKNQDTITPNLDFEKA
jgi:hypothetical protein